MIKSLPYTTIILIYNPNSTGGAAEAAQELRDRLAGRMPDVSIEVLPTKRAGHGVELARDAAQRYRQPLLISVSGDGGYHDIVNGAMQAEKPPICAVYPAGNANDHRRATKRHELEEAIIAGKVTPIDLLKVEIADGRAVTVYAHSYIGLGISPVVATELNRHTLNRWREMLLVLKTFHAFQPFQVETEEEGIQSFNSLIFANINQMAKVLTLSDQGHPHDGRFEIIRWPATSKRGLAWLALKAAVGRSGAQPQAKRYSFESLQPMPMQLDGEVVKLKKRSRVTVTAAAGALKTIR